MHPHNRHNFRPHFPQPPWQRHKRFFFPFAVLFGSITLLLVSGISIILYLVFSGQTELIRSSWLFLFCGIPLVFILVTFTLGSLTFRRFGRPMEDIFTAIDAIAEGNLAARVSERYPGDFGRLARRFNHMVTELERAENRRRNLTTDIAHELRNPLHIIQGNLEGMLDGVYDPNPENINNTLEETRLLARLVSDLQTLSLAETGQLTLHPSCFEIADLLEDVATSFSGQAAAGKLELVVEPPAEETTITADYDRMNQVLSNLASNAIRHTPAGGRVTLTGRQVSSGAIRLEVGDTGTGIPAEDLPYIFDRFWRGDRSRRDRQNSGLGLAIACQLVEAHGGTLMVESTPGTGSIFIVEMPG